MNKVKAAKWLAIGAAVCLALYLTGDTNNLFWLFLGILTD